MFIVCLVLSVPYLSSAKMAVKHIQLGKKIIKVEVADTQSKRAKGLMHRKERLPKDTGMLFIFNREEILSFWMKNTFIPLSIGFFNKDKSLVDIKKMQESSEVQIKFPQYTSKFPAIYALEMNQGWFKLNKVKVDTTFRFVDKK